MGGRGASSTEYSANRQSIDTKIYNKLKKEISEELRKNNLYPEFKKTQVNVGDGFSEADYDENSSNGKQTLVVIDTGLRYGTTFTLNGQKYNSAFTSDNDKVVKVQQKVFKILEKYNKKYKFDYNVDKKAFRSDNPSMSVDEWRKKRK